MIKKDMTEELIAVCSPIEEVNGIQAFIIHLNRRSHLNAKVHDRIAVQMPGHIILQNLGFAEEEVPVINSYIDNNLPAFVDMALERTEKV